MKKFLPLALLSLVAAPALAEDIGAIPSAATPAVAHRGSMLVDAKGARLAPVYRVSEDGSAQIVYEGRMVTVPGSTLSLANGRLTTSLKRSDVLALR